MPFHDGSHRAKLAIPCLPQKLGFPSNRRRVESGEEDWRFNFLISDSVGPFGSADGRGNRIL